MIWDTAWNNNYSSEWAPVGTYDGTVIRYLEGSTEVIVEGNFEGLLKGA